MNANGEVSTLLVEVIDVSSLRMKSMLVEDSASKDSILVQLLSVMLNK